MLPLSPILGIPMKTLVMHIWVGPYIFKKFCVNSGDVYGTCIITLR